MRREFSTKVKVAAFERCKGHCEDCGVKLSPGKYQYDHDLADGLGGEPTLENCKVRCTACHGAKTTKHDVPMIAKSKRVRARHIGAKKSSRPIPGSKASPWKRKFNGEVVPR